MAWDLSFARRCDAAMPFVSLPVSQPVAVRRRGLHVTLVALAALGAAGGAPSATAGDMPQLGIALIAELRSDLSGEQRRVRIRGVVTWRRKAGAIVQDASAGIWIDVANAVAGGLLPPDHTGLDGVAPGVEVEIEGLLHRGGYAPNLLPTAIRALGPAPEPAARPPDRGRFFSGADDCLRVTARGVLQGYRDDRDSWLLLMQDAGRGFIASVPKDLLVDDPQRLVDAEVRLSGVATSHFNARGQFLAPRLAVVHAADVVVEQPAAGPPFAAPEVPLAAIAQFRPEAEAGHRVRTRGIVTHAVPGRFLYLQDGTIGVLVETPDRSTFAPGDDVETAGFVHQRQGVAAVVEAAVRRVDRGTAPLPVRIRPDEILRINAAATRAGRIATPGDHLGCLVTFPARIVEFQNHDTDGIILLAAGDAGLAAVADPAAFATARRFAIGSEVAVTGIVQPVTDDDEDVAWTWRPRALGRIRLLLRSGGDIALLRAPSWWTPRRLAAALVATGSILAIALGWVWLLRRRVAATAARLAAEMRSRRESAVEFQATIRERNRLAANLHDTLLQTLGGIGYQLDACEAGGLLRPDGPRVHFDVARRMVNHATGELQQSVWAMRSLPMPEQTLSQSLRTLAARIGEGRQETIIVETAAGLDDVSAFVAGQVLLIVQEAVLNALRHGAARTIRVAVRPAAGAGAIHVTVEDDGVGFDTREHRGTESGHFGIHGMRERAERLGGMVKIESAPGQGTRVEATVERRDYDRDLDGVADSGEPEASAGGGSSSVLPRPAAARLQ
jgi:signal transduction histidine kinase